MLNQFHSQTLYNVEIEKFNITIKLYRGCSRKKDQYSGKVIISIILIGHFKNVHERVSYSEDFREFPK